MLFVYPACFYPCEEKREGLLLKSITPDPGSFISMLVLDMDAFAENNHINFSQVLQDSLTALYQQQ